jgi:CO dehydrogenase/acetyl-CoA synthase beta subunit
MLGKALMAIFRSELPRVEAIEVVFVTSTREDVQGLDEMAVDVRALGERFVKETWRAKGFDPDACSVSHDCRSCAEKPTCDDIREVAKFRRRAQP